MSEVLNVLFGRGGSDCNQGIALSVRAYAGHLAVFLVSRYHCDLVKTLNRCTGAGKSALRAYGLPLLGCGELVVSHAIAHERLEFPSIRKGHVNEGVGVDLVFPAMSDGQPAEQDSLGEVFRRQDFVLPAGDLVLSSLRSVHNPPALYAEIASVARVLDAFEALVELLTGV